jgi:3-hydroxymyristoyl/3-hydroxydecanoyl-(acyl carrier protein) dehydratase
MTAEERYTEILRAARRRPLWQPKASTRATAFDRAAIERLVPHRGSMLMLDEITAIDHEQQSLRAQRVLRPDDPGFRGHFPGEPVYPAFLQFEIIGQAGICLLDFVARGSTEIPTDGRPRSVRLLRAFDARLLAEIVPGDSVAALATVVENDELTSVVAAQLLRGETICSTVIVEVCFVGS